MDKLPSAKTLRVFKEKIDWDNEEQRQDLYRYFYSSIGRWRGQLPDLGKTFTPEEMDWILTQEVNKSSGQKLDLLDFVIRTGYTDKLCRRRGGGGPSSPHRSTALHQAAKRNMSWIVIRKLFELYNVFEANYVDEETGLTHLHVACKFRLFEHVKTFIELGHDPNCLAQPAAGFCFSSLQVACLTGQLEVAKACIEAGLKPDNQLEGVADDPPLQLAAAFNRVQLVRLLMKEGADPNLTRPDGKTTLHVVCETDNAFCMTELLLKLCVDHGKRLRIDRRDNHGRTPLLVALANKNWVVAELLMSRGADLKKADIEGVTPLHMIGKSQSSAGLVTILYNHHGEWPLQIDALNDDRETPLHLAASNGNHELVEFLLRNGADPNAQSKDGSTPLHLICKRSSGDPKRFFKIAKETKRTVRLDVRDAKGRTALEYTLAYFHITSFNVLLLNGATMPDDYFPDAEFFGERWNWEPVGDDRYNYQLRLVTEALATTDYLQRRCARKLLQGHVETLTHFLDRHGMFETPPPPRENWFRNDQFLAKASIMNMVKGPVEVPFFDLVKLSMDEIMKHKLFESSCCETLMYMVRMVDFDSFSVKNRMWCNVHLWKVAMRHYYEHFAPNLEPWPERQPAGFISTADYVGYEIKNTENDETG
ncbi:hypothetical protein TKK_0005308 [Trichogramma kaykai]